MTDPLSLGFIGRNGAYPANEAGRRADVVIAIGARFDDRSASSWLPGYSWNFPQSKLIHVDVDTDELGRNYPGHVDPGGRAHLPAAAAGRAGAPPGTRGDALEGLARRHREMERGLGGVHAAQLRHPRHADPARAGGRRLPGGAARRRHPRLRCRRQPQLVHAVLEGAPSPDHAELLGLLRHGLRRGGCARRQARGARIVPAWRLPATAASRWCRTCCAPRSSTTFPSCG